MTKRGEQARRLPATPNDDSEIDFEDVFERYYHPVTAFFSNRGFSAEECRDLAQETFLGVYKGFARFRGEASVKTWLFRIARNLSHNTRRDRGADKRTADVISLDETLESGGPVPLPVPEAIAGPLEDAIESERQQQLRQAVGELPAQMRRCFVLRYQQGRKYREIADVLQVSLDTVKSQLFQARIRLRRRLGERPGSEPGRRSS